MSCCKDKKDKYKGVDYSDPNYRGLSTNEKLIVYAAFLLHFGYILVIETLRI